MSSPADLGRAAGPVPADAWPGYALGLAAVVGAFIAVQKRRGQA